VGRGLIAAVVVVVLIGCPPIDDSRWARAQQADSRPSDDRRPLAESERLKIERHFFEYLRLQGVPPPLGLRLQSLREAPPGLKPGAAGDFWKPGEFDRLIGRR
jgi:hypothetical protein